MTDDLLHRLRHDLDGVHAAPGLGQRVIAQHRRKRLALKMTAAAACLGVGGGLLVMSDFGPDGSDKDSLVPANASNSPSATPQPTTASGAPLPADLSALVVRNGDRVTGTGWVNKQADGTVVLCNGSSTPENIASAVGQGSNIVTPPAPIKPCPTGLPLEGVDLGALLKPDVRPDGSVEGTASITGTYSAGKLIVETQEPAPVQRGSLPQAVVTPCPAPPQGWPEDGDVGVSEERLRDRIELDPLTRDPRLVTIALSRPFPGTAILVVLARDAATKASLQAELTAKAPRRVCVVVSRFTLAQQKAAANKLWAAHPDSTPSTGIRTNWQLGIQASPQLVTQSLAELAAGYPEGLLTLEPRLRPIR